MTDVQVQAAAETEPRQAMSFPARAVGIFTAPSRVFEEMKRRPAWLAPLLVVTLLLAGLYGVLFVTPEGATALRQQMQEANEKAGRQIPPETVDKQVAVTRYFWPASIVVFTPVATLLLAGLVYLIFSIGLGGEGTFKQTFAAYCHVGLIGLIGGLVTVAVIYLKQSVRASTTLTAFLPFLDEASFAYKFFRCIDVFVLWQLGVLSIGMGILNNLSTKKSATVLFSLYLSISLIIAVIWQVLS
ncbi:MAG TPA: Yip1 family protein [Candidatus Polarisedimenticolia bacterium]|jgi:hypothetical protein|nr:Yip1 family protein [Candidatus Polarisedimenticolia bacterium]